MSQDVRRIAICGAGPVGMMLALTLARRGVAGADIILLDARTVEQAVLDPRSVALSWGSRQMMDDAGAWPLPSPATAIHTIHVSRAGQFGRSLMDRAEHDVDALGYVARYGDVVDALARACVRAGIDVMRPARVVAIDEDAAGVVLHLDDGRTVAASVAVQAEGGTFGAQGNKTGAHSRDYGQSAVIARVSASRPVAHRAFERFTSEGPLALLPQAGSDGHQYALVWCAKPERAQALLALGDAAFLAALGHAFGERVGVFTAVSKRTSYPLGLTTDARSTARTVAIGNAAQTLHPVAGQGLNLGLRDAAVLARMLAQGESLAGFDAMRAGDRALTVGLTDAMARVFAGTGPVQSLLGLSLGVLDAVGPARRALASVMMFGRR
jgi:2-octaprenyl-6-methoxyphenol hydroxylase